MWLSSHGRGLRGIFRYINSSNLSFPSIGQYLAWIHVRASFLLFSADRDIRQVARFVPVHHTHVKNDGVDPDPENDREAKGDHNGEEATKSDASCSTLEEPDVFHIVGDIIQVNLSFSAPSTKTTHYLYSSFRPKLPTREKHRTSTSPAPLSIPIKLAASSKSTRPSIHLITKQIVPSLFSRSEPMSSPLTIFPQITLMCLSGDSWKTSKQIPTDALRSFTSRSTTSAPSGRQPFQVQVRVPNSSFLTSPSHVYSVVHSLPIIPLQI
jgi:hypothetical protein